MSHLLKKQDDLSTQIASQKENISSLINLKFLFCGSGKTLENVVSKVFQDIGFSIEPSGQNRDDLIISLRNKIAVVEIKGTKGSASEGYAAQLEKWVSTYLTDHGVSAKGILIVNAFNTLPPSNRKEKSFPDQMLPYSEKRNHCLMTGLDLLNIYFDFKRSLLSLDDLMDKIFKTDGILHYEPINSDNIKEI